MIKNDFNELKKTDMRFERKYLLSEKTAFLIKQRISYILAPDSNNADGKYKVSSLYFDDRHNTALYEKQNGILHREKMRIRYYNGSMDTIHLECKQKHGDRVHKEKDALTPRQYDMMCMGEYGFIKEEMSPVLRKFYIAHKIKHMRPVVVVEYDRQAYMYRQGNVRVTFDSGISARKPLSGQSYIALDGKNVIMEIKYDHYLPSLVGGLFSGFQLTQQLAISKYVMARLAMQGK